MPLAGSAAFFLLSLVTVRLLRPAQPRTFFLGYATILVIVAAYVYVRVWPLVSMEAVAGLVCCLLLQTLICLTMWNSFYSLLWGFSGGLMHDLYNEPELRHVDRLVRSYEGVDGLDRILARRLPNLAAGGYIELRGDTLRLRWKGRAIALGTLAAFKTFSLGMGGGVK
jgi:hypothetical protein